MVPATSNRELDSAVARVEAIRRARTGGEGLLPLLDERASLYRGLSTSVVERFRGYVLASFELTGTPHEALPFIVEELETGNNPYAVGGAARALRRARQLPPNMGLLLVGALGRLALADDVVRYDEFVIRNALPQAGTSVLMELSVTLSRLVGYATDGRDALRRLLSERTEEFSPRVAAELRSALDAMGQGPGHDCCCQPLAMPEPGDRVQTRAPVGTRDLEAIVLEDQNGEKFTFGSCFGGRPSVLTFLYTRCDNPNKCSASVRKLAEIQRALAVGGEAARVNIAAVTYDPLYDHPRRLHAYGDERGFSFTDRARFVRTVGSFEPVADAFRLGVSFGPATVNRHRIELFVLDAGGVVSASFERESWQVEQVLRVVKALLNVAGAGHEAVARPQASTASL